MTSAERNSKPPSGAKPPAWRARLTMPLLSLLLLVLALPVFSFTFLSDDYNFILRAWPLRLEDLLPDSRSAFYRPIPRELYFSLLAMLGRDNPLWGHVLNACLGMAAVVLVTLVARRLAGRRIGFLTGALFATLGPLPLLIGWISGAQDLFAMVFLAAAVLLQLRRQSWASLACTAGALLSKETTLFFLPALATMGWVLHRDRAMLRRDALGFGALGLSWALLHPKLRALGTQGGASGDAGYVGLDNSNAAIQAVRQLGALLNIPIGNAPTPWLPELTLVAVAGAVLVTAAWWSFEGAKGKEAGPKFPMGRILQFGVLLGLVPALLTAVTAKHWYPYYACLPAIGTSLLLAMGVEKLGTRATPAALVGFLLLGVWSRGIDLRTRQTPTESNLRAISRNLEYVESGMKKLHSWLPDSSRLYITIQAPTELSIHYHLLRLQAARVWYLNATIRADDPVRLERGRGPEFLFWITPGCDVFEIGLDDLRVRSPGPKPDIRDYQKAIRGLAYGYYSAHEVDRAVSMLVGMQEIDSLTWAFDRRLAATMLTASGRSSEGKKLCEGLAPLDRAGALNAIAAVLGPLKSDERFESAAFQAFGVSERDSDAYRFLMNYFSDQAQLSQAMRMAERLRGLIPGDPEADAMIQAIRKVPKWEQVVVPVAEEGF